jgi:hypothetical protein
VEGSREYGIELSGSMNAGKFLSGCPINGSSRKAQLSK